MVILIAVSLSFATMPNDSTWQLPAMTDTAQTTNARHMPVEKYADHRNRLPGI
jgi:hypothetical protein